MRALAALIAFFAVPLCAADLAVNVSGATGPDFANKLDDTDVEVARFALQAGGGDVDVDAVTIHFTNAAAANEAFTAVQLFYDADGNGTFDGSEQVGTAQVPNGTDDFVTFTDTFTAVSGVIRELQLRVDIGNDAAAYGEAFQFIIDGASSITLASGTDTISGGLPATSNTIEIRHSVNELVPGTGNPSAPRNVALGRTNVGALHFIVSSLNATPPGQLQGIDLDEITISVTLGNAAQTDIVTRLALWQDDGDSAFEPGNGEVLIQERTPADGAKWAVSGSVISVTFDGSAVQLLSDIPAGGAKALWVGVDFGDAPESVCEISVNRDGITGALGPAADHVTDTPNSISGNVINVIDPPEPPPPSEAQGEGGCTTVESRGWWFGLLLLFLVAIVFARCRVKTGFPEANRESTG